MVLGWNPCPLHTPSLLSFFFLFPSPSFPFPSTCITLYSIFDKEEEKDSKRESNYAPRGIPPPSYSVTACVGKTQGR